MSNNKASALLLLVACVWGSGYVITQFALDEGFTPFQIIAGRFMIGSIVLCAVFYKTLLKTTKKEILYGVITGMCLFVGFAFQTVGQIYTTPAIVAFITAAHIVMIPFFDWRIFKIRPDLYVLAAVVLTLVGVSLISFTDPLTVTGGIVLILIGTVFYALQVSTLGYFVKNADSVRVTIVMTVSTAVAAFALAFVSALINNDLPPLTAKGIGSIMFLGLINTALCFLGQGVAMRHMPSSKAAVILSTECVFGAIVSVLLYNEVLTYQAIAGCAIIFFAVILAETKLEFLKKSVKI